MASFTRGFVGRSRDRRDPRLPPGQYDAGDEWPVLNAEVTPTLPTSSWTFTVDGLVEQPTTWTWDEIHALPPSTYDGAIHCVTTWSKFDMTFTGVSVDTLLAAAGPRPEAAYLFVTSHTGSTTNLPLADLDRDDVLLATHHNGEPLTPDHGAPMRLVVPHLYFWKSAKWIRGLEFAERNRPGFWERNGYHMRGDPWGEERYSF